MRICLAVTVVMLLVAAAPASAEDLCGVRPNDWCAAPAGDPCGRHADAEACRKDRACYGMAYKGESLVACKFDERGFGLNCPTVGCTSERPGT
jgi:hypothetical protein